MSVIRDRALRRRRGRCFLIAFSVCAASTGIALAGEAPSPGPSCSFDPESRMLSVAAGDSFYESITRAGDAIVFLATDYDVDPPGLRQITCLGGEPTVANTDTVVLQAPNGESIPRIDLRGGPFAPGATPEPDESSEIEFSLPGPPRAFGLLVRGSSDADSIRVGELGHDTGFNFNHAEANPDVDFQARGRQAGLILWAEAGTIASR